MLNPDLWNAIRNLDLDTNGGWDIGGTEEFLYLVRVNPTGATRWVLASEAEAPDGAFQAPMTSGDWADLKGGTYDPETNKITVRPADHYIIFHNDGGEAQAKREDA